VVLVVATIDDWRLVVVVEEWEAAAAVSN